jgi:hypothetical protein
MKALKEVNQKNNINKEVEPNKLDVNLNDWLFESINIKIYIFLYYYLYNVSLVYFDFN